MKQLAIIGSTASGKSDLALNLAHQHNAIILSIDSLSIYQHIDIASAKPSKEELASIKHFGINVLNPDENASVFSFIDEYHRAVEYAQKHSKNLILVGGSSFYLKSMLDGLSFVPPISDTTRDNAAKMLKDLANAHHFLMAIDPITMEKITHNDSYRIEKMLHLYLETNTPPSQWFKEHPPKPIINNCPVLNISLDRELLRERISLRTNKMVDYGLIDEVAHLEQCYGRSPNSMKSIGIIETLRFLDGLIDKSQLIDEISTHTGQLAKRQQTFNNNQFSNVVSGSTKELADYAKHFFSLEE